MRSKQDTTRCLLDKVGKYFKRVGITLPSKYIQKLYDKLLQKETNVLSQFKIDIIRLNGYFHQINAISTDQYVYD